MGGLLLFSRHNVRGWCGVQPPCLGVTCWQTRGVCVCTELEVPVQGSAFGAASIGLRLLFICRCVQHVWRKGLGACENVLLRPCGTLLCEQSAVNTMCPFVADFLVLIMQEVETICVSPSGF